MIRISDKHCKSDCSPDFLQHLRFRTVPSIVGTRPRVLSQALSFAPSPEFQELILISLIH